MVYQADFDDDDQLFVDFVAPADGDIYVANATTEGINAYSCTYIIVKSIASKRTIVGRFIQSFLMTN